MADKNIGALPQAADLYDDSMLVVEQQGQAMKLSGAQFRAFGKQAVIQEVQGYVDQAQAAADSIVDMTVQAHTLDTGQPATVSKGTKDGKVNLDFGLPRGEQGVSGPAGPSGPRGPKGDPGTGLEIAGRYDTTADVPSPQEGKSYYIGTQAPYDLHTYLDGEWVNNGPLSGGGGSVPLEDAVTLEGGGELVMGEALGSAPFQVIFTDEEEPPLTAQDVAYGEGSTVQDAIDGLFTCVSNGKQAVASAITDKGVPTAQDAAFETMAQNIRAISSGTDTSDATATPGDILAGKTAYTAAGKVEGIIPTLAARTITPGTADQTIANGQYLGGTQTIQGDPNLTSANIKSGVSIFGVSGALESTFQATLTVKADIGAVVTATHSGGTEVSALSTTGAVALELPLEGTWTVTAVRGVTQYNSVLVNVTSRYSAELTAQVHIERVGTGTALSPARSRFAAASNKNYAIFAGGEKPSRPYTNAVAYDWADAYDENLVKNTIGQLSAARSYLSAAALPEYVLFAGGAFYPGDGTNKYFDTVDAYNENLVKETVPRLLHEQWSMAAASIGKYALFGGGANRNGADASVTAYNEALTQTAAMDLLSAVSGSAAASNQNYAIFAGGSDGTANAYDSSLTRKTPVKLSLGRGGLAAARAGNYVLFAGGSKSNVVDAYDLFLTRTAAENLIEARGYFAAATLNDFAVFGGGVNSGSEYSGAVDIFDPYLTRTNPDALNSGRISLAAAAIGNYVLFGGGETLGNHAVDTVDVYQYV